MHFEFKNHIFCLIFFFFRMKENQKISYPFLIISKKSKFHLCWSFFLMIIILFNSFFVPLEIAFEELNNSAFNPEYFTIGIFFVDILFNLRTTFFDFEENEIISGKKIFVNYIKSINFIIDCVSAFPVSEILSEFENDRNLKWLILLKSLRVLRLNRLVKYFRGDSLKIIYKLTRYFVVFLLTVINSHIILF